MGVKLADNNHFFPNSNPFYLDIIAGKHDQHYADVATAWVKAGFKTPAFRIGYEMDGKFMPDYQGEDAATQANWVQAFRRVSTVMHAAAIAAGATSAARIWNPASMNWTALSVADSYPGDDVVDCISLDVYSPIYNGSLYNYDAPTYGFAADQTAWLARVENRRHYWTFPSANEWNQQGNGSGFGIRDAVAMCVKHKKALAISECGMGSANASIGMADDPEFPAWLKGELDLAGKQGVAISHVNIWNIDMGDGPWSFDKASGKPLAAASWAKNFGGWPGSARRAIAAYFRFRIACAISDNGSATNGASP